MTRTSDGIVIVAMLVLLSFVDINVDPGLANSFTKLVIIAFVLLAFEFIPGLGNRRVDIPIVREGNKLFESLGVTAITYFVFLLIATLSVSIIFPGTFSSQEPIVGQSFSLTKSLILSEKEPVLSGKHPLTIFNFGTLIPAIETMAVAFLLEFLVFLFLAGTEKLDRRVFGLMMLIAVGAGAFHLNAKALAPNITPTLFVVFLFFLVSMVIMFIKKQKIEAILVHVFANTAVLASIPVAIIVTIVVGYLLNNSVKVGGG